MSLIKLLQGIGDRLGILETVEIPGTPQVARIQTRVVSLQDLASEIRADEVRALAESPAELTIPWDKIYETAGISPNPGDWTIDKLKQLISSEPCKNKSREEVQKFILDQLRSEGIAAENIVKDAMARDQAMDSYETFAREKMQVRMESCRKKLSEIESRIRDLQEEGAALESALKADEEKWLEWRKNKREREQELATLLGYIIDHAVISLEEETTE